MICWLIPFALIVYLGMKRGGFEQPVRGEVGIAVWWVVLLGLAAVELPRRPVGRAGWIGLGLLAAFAGWTAIGVSGSESSEKSVIEVARVVVYVGVFALALMLGGGDRIRSTIGAIGAGCAVIAVVAMLSRLHPSWFPSDDLAQVLVGVQSRLRYPVGYWNALAGLTAIGLPLVIWGATSARSTLLRGLAAATVPTMALTIYFTYSRAGVVAGAIALLAFVALSERRLELVPPLTAIGAISGLVVWQASRRSSLTNALGDPTAISQGNEMLIAVAVGAVICGVVVAGLRQAEIWGLAPRIPAVPRHLAMTITAVVAVSGVAAFVALGGAGAVADGFDEFKQPAGVSATSTRLASVAGNGRWEYWSVAVDAAGTAPLTGIGPGTYELWWNQHRESNSVIRDAHSLFVETLGELGIVGLVLIAGLVGFVLVVGVARAVRADGGRRRELAAMTAAALAFAVAAGLDWLWELAVIPVAFLFVAAAVLTARPDEDQATVVASAGERPQPRRSGRNLARVAGAAIATGAILVIAVPTLAAERLSDSQADFDDGDFVSALSKAESAAALEPYSAAPRMLEARSYEALGKYSEAAIAAREATERESTNWEPWYLLSRIQDERGDKQGSALSLHRAQELNPLSNLLNPNRCGAEGKICANPSAPG